MASESVPKYGILVEAHLQPVLFELGDSAQKKDDALSYRGLEKRLHMLRDVKLELENEKERLRKKTRYISKRLERANKALMEGSDVHKALYKCEFKLNHARLRMMELKARMNEVTNDYDRLHETVDKYRKEFRCSMCQQVKKVECFGKDVDQPTGYDSRCRLCLREKTQKWRAVKKFMQQ